MIKSIIFWVFLGVHTILWASSGILLSLFAKNDKIIHFYIAVPWSRIILWFSNVRVKIRNLDRIDKINPVFTFQIISASSTSFPFLRTFRSTSNLSLRRNS